MFCTCSRICSIATFISTDDAGQLQRRRLRAQRVGLALQFLDQEVQPLADFAAACAAGARSRRGASAGGPALRPRRCGSRRPRLRSGRAPARLRRGTVCAAPLAASASFQRSRKRCCWRCTTAGTSGSACVGERRAGARCVRCSTAARRAPSRPRASRRPATHRARPAAPARRAARPLRAPRHHCSASCTDSGARLGQPALHRAFDARQAVQLLGAGLRPRRRRRRARWSGAARSCRA